VLTRDKWVTWGVALIAVGGILLLSNLGVLPETAADLLWPLILITIGVWMLFKDRPAAGAARRSRFPMLAAVLIALGAAFLLDDLLGPRSTWPLVVVAIGVVFLIRGRTGGALA
jgi:hypothetical protein